ncbi:Phage-related protein [Desulfovibrio sp. DV]|uniref:type II toxin-antitoxin system HicB family antitoxin n=1 Tax=Desulfovibrio sp. DV TaxID=1844708 RepID=UPI000960F5E6|nr:type II toxin-antitoxin system HicB family antitoxin [Desulfovibrio sp. DV]OLN31311.1 Phage-related protein [Desulfovibrio sp. DV]
MTQGDTEARAMEMAVDALSGHIHTLRDLDREVPPPSPLAALAIPSGARVALVPGPASETPPVRISVSINQGLLRDVDAAAKREGMTRSGFLAAAARTMLSQIQA